ncbi:MAG: DNA mismatch repair endonuclease MutL [Lachnospiraceae bacterium]|jgi:DNA mismatch repair protein MutL
MRTIRILDNATIDKIAAGEVVERPANVIKELMENSIDSGANAISVEIRDGGKDLIRITDNGCGIPHDQVRLAFQRHSTSKIDRAEDLNFISTLGFRGEALSSIAAVSDLELFTKTEDSLTGTIYRLSAGKEISFEEAGLPDGTTIIITNLFHNVPARLKFLRTGQSEGTAISEVVEKIALSNPDVAIKFTNNGALRLNTSGNGSLKDVIYAVYGREMASNLIPVTKKSETVSVEGYVGKPEVARRSRAFENYFINKRYVKDRIIQGAIEAAYKGRQMKGTFPFTALNFTIEPRLIDVNVHPSKMEVRFHDNEAVYDCISHAVGEALGNRENIPSFSIGIDDKKEEIKKTKNAPEPFETERKKMDEPAYKRQISAEKWEACEQVFRDHSPYSERRKKYAEEESITDDGITDFVRENVPDESSFSQQTFFDDRFLSSTARCHHRIIGKIFNTYWIVEYDEKMFIIDQHAAHEKVIYERLLSSLRRENYTSQYISPGKIVSLSAGEEMCLVQYMQQLKKIGFDIDHFGGSDYIITAVPSELFDIDSSELLHAFIDEIMENPSAPAGSELLLDRIAMAACKAAVKGGTALSSAEADRLIEELLSLDNPYNCPHGRPTIISMTKNEFEKKFKRII